MTRQEAELYVSKIQAARAVEQAILQEILDRDDYEFNEEKNILHIVGQREVEANARNEAEFYLEGYSNDA